MDSITFGEILSKIIKSQGISQAELAGQLGVSQMAVSKLIHDKNSPSIDRSLSIFSRLGYTIAVVPQDANLDESSFLIRKAKEEE